MASKKFSMKVLSSLSSKDAVQTRTLDAKGFMCWLTFNCGAFFQQKQRNKHGLSLVQQISAVLKGPGWFPGTPRLGDLEMVPEIPRRRKYDPQVIMHTTTSSP